MRRPPPRPLSRPQSFNEADAEGARASNAGRLHQSVSVGPLHRSVGAAGGRVQRGWGVPGWELLGSSWQGLRMPATASLWTARGAKPWSDRCRVGWGGLGAAGVRLGGRRAAQWRVAPAFTFSGVRRSRASGRSFGCLVLNDDPLWRCVTFSLWRLSGRSRSCWGGSYVRQACLERG